MLSTSKVSDLSSLFTFVASRTSKWVNAILSLFISNGFIEPTKCPSKSTSYLFKIVIQNIKPLGKCIMKVLSARWSLWDTSLKVKWSNWYIHTYVFFIKKFDFTKKINWLFKKYKFLHFNAFIKTVNHGIITLLWSFDFGSGIWPVKMTTKIELSSPSSARNWPWPKKQPQ